jgi:hypothetical protein
VILFAELILEYAKEISFIPVSPLTKPIRSPQKENAFPCRAVLGYSFFKEDG